MTLLRSLTRKARPEALRRLIGYAAVVAAAVFLGSSLWPLWQSGDAATPSGASGERAKVANVAARQIAILNSMDSAQLEQGLAQWLSASTGPLNDELRRTQAEARKKFTAGRVTARGEVAGIAVTALDPAAGNATVIASVRVQLTPAKGQPTEQRRRYQAGLERTPAGWKIKSLTAIAAGAS